MRKVFTIFLITLLTLPFWVKGVVLLYFLANRAYIIEQYCENKGKPQMHCEGKCYLHKQLQKAETLPSETRETPLSKWLKKWELSEFDSSGQHLELHVFTRGSGSRYLPNGGHTLHGHLTVLELPPDLDEHYAGLPAPASSELFALKHYKSCT
ncbi:MAG: hypothetical protein IPM98_09655 [Lewinellaceae bacterium]|nr:hypothetical protein [Lewinellaceae bacterium]